MSTLRSLLQPTLAQDRASRHMRIYSAATRYTVLTTAVEAAVAAGSAYAIGSHLPGSLSRYAYYAAMGAISVLMPAARDTFLFAVRTAVSLGLGVLLAFAVSATGVIDSVTTGMVILLGMLIGAIPWLGETRSWVPLSALFTLTVGGVHPEAYATAYLVQIVIGALVGLAINYLFIKQAAVPKLDRAVTRLRAELIDQLAELADLLDGTSTQDTDRDESIVRLTRIELEVQQAAETAHAGRRWYPARWQHPEREEPLLALGAALTRCVALTRAVGLLLPEQPDQTQDGDEPRRSPGRLERGGPLATQGAYVLGRIQEVLRHPRDASSKSAHVRAADESIDRYLTTVRELMTEDDEARHLATALGIDARRALVTFVQAYEDQREAVYGPEQADPAAA